MQHKKDVRNTVNEFKNRVQMTSFEQRTSSIKRVMLTDNSNYRNKVKEKLIYNSRIEPSADAQVFQL